MTRNIGVTVGRARKKGATHVAPDTVTGTAQRHRLTFDLRQNAERPVGKRSDRSFCSQTRGILKELHDGLVAEFAPAGQAEEDIVATIARLFWRKQNLSTYRLAEWAKDRSSAIRAKYGPCFDPSAPDPFPLLGGFEREDLVPQQKLVRTPRRRTTKLETARC